LLALVPPPASADWPVTGYPLCTVAQDLNPPVGVSGLFCAFGCEGTLTLFWQDGRSNFGSIYTAVVGDVLPPPPPPVSEATLYLQRPGLQLPGAAANVRFVSCLSQFCPQTRVFVWSDQPDTIPSLIRARRDLEPDPGVDWGDGLVVAAGAGDQVSPGV